MTKIEYDSLKLNDLIRNTDGIVYFCQLPTGPHSPQRSDHFSQVHFELRRTNDPFYLGYGCCFFEGGFARFEKMPTSEVLLFKL